LRSQLESSFAKGMRTAARKPTLGCVMRIQPSGLFGCFQAAGQLSPLLTSQAVALIWPHVEALAAERRLLR
jgi:hypothetical protein